MKIKNQTARIYELVARIGIFIFSLALSFSVHATFNLDVRQLTNNNNSYNDQGVLMQWSGSFNLNGHARQVTTPENNFLNSPAVTNYYNAQADHVMYFGGIGSSFQQYLEYDTGEKPGIFRDNDIVKNLFPKKSAVTKHETDTTAINHAYKAPTTGNSFDSTADYIMMGDTFAIGFVDFAGTGAIQSLQQILLPLNYQSGSQISGSLFLRGETLESLGILETFGINLENQGLASSISGYSTFAGSNSQTYSNFDLELFFDGSGNPGTTVTVDVDTSNIPEPSTYALILGSIAFALLIIKRK